MRSSAPGVLSLTLMLNTLFRAGFEGNNACTLLKFCGAYYVLCWPMTSAQTAETFAKGMVEGECQNNGFACQCECQFVKFSESNISRR